MHGEEQVRTFEDKRKERLDTSRMHLVSQRVEDIEELYKDKSYALVDKPRKALVPIIPRHMTSQNWRDLFWHDVRLLVIHGRKYQSLCSACDRALGCIAKGKDRRNSFECMVSPSNLSFKKTIRKKGEPACPR